MLVLAGPGSGKTAVLVERIRYLIEARNVSPGSILTITFSKKASIEMKTRFYDLIGDKFYPVTFGTFHSVFYNILKTYHNYSPDSILTPAEKIAYIKKIFKRLSIENADSDEACFDMLSKISIYKSDIGHMNCIFDPNSSLYSNRAYYPNNVPYPNDAYYSNDVSYTNSASEQNSIMRLGGVSDEEFLRIYTEYEKMCASNGKLDFDDMIVKCFRLLKENNAVLKKWQGVFKYFLVDEFQDVNDIQYETLLLLAGDEKNIFAVGDDDQSIYGFRGSKPELMKRFLKLDSCKVTDMYKNYRCAEDVIAAAGCLIANNKERIVKNQISCKDDTDGTVYTAAFASEKEEADFIVNKLLEMQMSDGTVESTAILFRTEKCAAYLEEKLKMSGIGYVRSAKSGSFYDNDAVKDIISYLKIAISENEVSDIYRILNKPDRGISREEIAGYNLGGIDRGFSGRDIPGRDTWNGNDFDNNNLARKALNSNFSDNYVHNNDVPLPENTSLHNLVSEINSIKNMSCFAAVNYILKGLGYYKYLLRENSRHGKSRATTDEFVDEILMRAKNFPNIQSWLEYIEDFAADNEKNTDDKHTGNTDNDTAGKVVLQTAHSSKGLEYDTVFIIGMTEGLFPHHRAKTDNEIEEERRLMYVAITRAKKNLYILGRGEEQHGKIVSRFVPEVKNCGKTIDIKV